MAELKPQNYSADLERGHEYQDFITREFMTRGVVMANFVSRKAQLYGENTLGMEVKFDDVMRLSGRIFFECACWSVTLQQWVQSGVNKADGCWLYTVGNYSTAYVFSKRMLARIAERAQFNVVSAGITQQFVTNNGRAQGFCMDLNEAEKRCVWKLEFEEEVFE